MERTVTFLKKRIVWLITVLMLPMCLVTSGCSLGNSLFKSSDTSTVNKDRTIWHSREQNVRIEKQDGMKGGMIAQNDHPIMLEPGQIRSALASLEVRLTQADKPVPVFTGPELDVLGKQLSEGLVQAGPDEDVTFVVVGQRRAVYGLAKQRKVTSGRVFYKEGKLNIIFGSMVDDLKEHTDPRLEPHTPGSRTRPASHAWILEDEPDMQFYAGGDMIRSDWLMLDLASMAAHEALGVKPAKTGRTVSQTPASAPERVSAPQEAGQVQAPAYQAPAVTQIPQTGKASKTIEERLQILNDLKNKKLITDEEYKAKRANILNDL
jgi:hypothetical protein